MNNQNFSYCEYSKRDHLEKFKNISQLLKESWELYCRKIKILLGIIGLPVGFSFLFWFFYFFLFDASIKYSIWFSIINLFFYLGSLFLWLWTIPSLLYSFKEGTSIKESYKSGFKILSSYIWVYFLLTVIIIGSFLLFIIPGILFSIWFSLAIFILVFEEKKGFDALFKSKYLVKGNFWGILVRFVVLGLTIGLGLFLFFALILFLIENKQIENQITKIIDYLIQLFILPFFLVYGFVIYNNLKEIKAETSYEKPARSKKIKYALPGILGTITVGLLISLTLFNIFLGRDEPPIDDSDLWLQKIEIPKEKNAFYPLSEASKKIYLPKEKEKIELFTKMVEGEKWDSNFAEELIKNNEEVFIYFEKAIELPYFQSPELQDPKTIEFETMLTGISGLRNVAKLNSVKANYLLTQGKEKEALDLIIKTIKIGQMIEDSPRNTLISYFFGRYIKEVGLQRLRTMIPNLTLSPEILKNYIVELDQFKVNKEGLINLIKIEYIVFNNTKSKIDAGFAGELFGEEFEKFGIEKTSFEIKAATKLNYLYKPNQTQRIFAEYFRNLINYASKDCDETRILENKPLTPSSKIKMIFTENLLGKLLHDIITLNLSGFFDRKCLENFSVIGTQTLIAIKAYQIDNGKIPTSLVELIPKYLSDVPKDPFGGAMKYSPEKKIIYSLGKDLTDSGGSEGNNWETMEDPTFKIEF